MANLANKRILIFGGSSGIGFAVAEACLREQAEEVIIASSNTERVNKAVARLLEAKQGPGKVIGRTVDVKHEAVIIALLEEVGEVDHIVYTCGDQLRCAFPNFTLQDAKACFDVRFWGNVIVAKNAKFRPAGSLTFTTSSTVTKPVRSLSLVTSAVGATEVLCRGLALDLAPTRVNVVRPGAVDTELWLSSRPEAKDYTFNLIKKTAPVGHVAKPEEIAHAYIFLMKCSFITGECIPVDGGYTWV